MRKARVPRDLEDVVDSCLDEDPQRRPASAQVLAELARGFTNKEIALTLGIAAVL